MQPVMKDDVRDRYHVTITCHLSKNFLCLSAKRMNIAEFSLSSYALKENLGKQA